MLSLFNAHAAPRSPGERGSMLIVALGVLTLMSLLAGTFWVVMSLERSAAAAYVDQKRAQLVAEAGIQNVAEDVKAIAREPLFSGGALQPFVYGVGKEVPSNKESNPAYAIEKITKLSDPYFYRRLGRTYSVGGEAEAAQGRGVDECRLKIIDTSALLDLNFPIEFHDPQTPVRRQTLELMLEALGIALAAKHGGYNPLSEATFTGPTGTHQGAYAVLCYRMTLDGRRFHSKSQLQEVLSERGYRILSDYVTCHGWVDEKAVEASPVSGTHTGVRLVKGGRAQINVNLAPEEVLTAVIAPIAGRRYAQIISAQTQFMEEDPNNPGQAGPRYFPAGSAGLDQTITSAREEKAYDPRRQGWVYMGPLGGPSTHQGPINIANAQRIARWIIDNRPFKSYADFHARILEMMNADMAVLDTSLPSWEQGTVQLFPPKAGFDPEWDLTGIDQQPWFKEFVRQAGYSLLLANFGACFTPNTANPNAASALPVDKGSLLWPMDPNADTPQGTVAPRQTFDFCFDTRGVYEVTSLGQIRGKSGEIMAQEKLFTVIRVMDHVTLRTQADFEINDARLGDDRTDFTTLPETRYLFTGPLSRTDAVPAGVTTLTGEPFPFGHVEIAPLMRYDNDGAPFPILNFLQGRGGQPNWGTPTFAHFFDGLYSGKAQAGYLHADVYDSQDAAAAGGYDRWDEAGMPAFAHAWGTLWNKATNAGLRVIGGGSTYYRDGFHSSYRRNHRYHLWFRAGANVKNDVDQGVVGSTETGAPPETDGNGPHKQGNVHYRKGAVEFWYKPDYDWAYTVPGTGGTLRPTPIYAGLLCATRVWWNPLKPQTLPPKDPPAQATASDGTQLYVFRNSEGYLRATRIYFRAAGDPTTEATDVPPLVRDPAPGDNYDGGTPSDDYFQSGQYVQGGGAAGAVELYREAAQAIPYDASANPPTGYPWPPDEFAKDEAIIYARTDAWVAFDPDPSVSPLAGWRANEWHHIAVYWDDGATGAATDPNAVLKIFVDGVPLSRAYGMPQNPTGINQYMFCRVNEDTTKGYPKDTLYIGGIERQLAISGSGVFKHDDVLSGDQRHIQLHACGTIDDVIIWNGQASPGANFVVPKRFQREATYKQLFDLSAHFPDGDRPIELARLSWQALLPRRYGRGTPMDTVGGTNSVTISLGGTTGGTLQGGPGVVFDDMLADESWAPIVPATGTGPVLMKPGDELSFEATLRAATFRRGSFEFQQIDTPALNEVSVSYFLPVEDTLLKERIAE